MHDCKRRLLAGLALAALIVAGCSPFGSGRQSRPAPRRSFHEAVRRARQMTPGPGPMPDGGRLIPTKPTPAPQREKAFR